MTETDTVTTLRDIAQKYQNGLDMAEIGALMDAANRLQILETRQRLIDAAYTEYRQRMDKVRKLR